jgi:hypothetical protein
MGFMKLRAFLAGLACAVLMAVPQTAYAGAVTREGFAFPNEGEVKIVVFRPDVYVGSMKVGGVDEPNPDWTQAARANIQAAMENAAEARNSNMRFLPEYEGDEGRLINDYRGLFQVVSLAIFQHELLRQRLPTKEMPREDRNEHKKYRFDWELGAQVARLRDVTGGDYAMFVYTYDSYGDAGRKVAQILVAGLFGSWMPAGVHIGYAGLVDLRTGHIVWFNTDVQMGGDVRDSEGAVKRVGQLLRGFPERDQNPVPEWMATPQVTAQSENEAAPPAEPVEPEESGDPKNAVQSAEGAEEDGSAAEAQAEDAAGVGGEAEAATAG